VPTTAPQQPCQRAQLLSQPPLLQQLVIKRSPRLGVRSSCRSIPTKLRRSHFVSTNSELQCFEATSGCSLTRCSLCAAATQTLVFDLHLSFEEAVRQWRSKVTQLRDMLDDAVYAEIMQTLQADERIGSVHPQFRQWKAKYVLSDRDGEPALYVLSDALHRKKPSGRHIAKLRAAGMAEPPPKLLGPTFTVLKRVPCISQVSAILKKFHDPTPVHAGVDVMYERVHLEYIGISRDLCKAYVKRCPKCKERPAMGPTPKGFFQQPLKERVEAAAAATSQVMQPLVMSAAAAAANGISTSAANATMPSVPTFPAPRSRNELILRLAANAALGVPTPGITQLPALPLALPPTLLQSQRGPRHSLKAVAAAAVVATSTWAASR
jgi:hypothetical protein